VAQQSNLGLGTLTVDVSRSHNWTRIHPVGLLWTSNQPIAEAATYSAHNKHTTDEHPCSQRDSNPRSQQLKGCRPTP